MNCVANQHVHALAGGGVAVADGSWAMGIADQVPAAAPPAGPLAAGSALIIPKDWLKPH